MSDSLFALAIIGQKGGPGKTSLGLNLAVAAAEQGLTSVIIDLDQQATAANWKERRDNLKRPTFQNPAVTFSPPSRLRQTLEAAEQYAADFVIIDSPGKAATYADIVLVPMEPRMSNLETIPGVYGLLQAVDLKLRKERGLPNQAHPLSLCLTKCIRLQQGRPTRSNAW
jgi:chromosome partitioning protein